MRQPQRRFYMLLFGVTVLFSIVIGEGQVRAQRPIVFVAPIEGVIDLGFAPFVQRVLDQATTAVALISLASEKIAEPVGRQQLESLVKT